MRPFRSEQIDRSGTIVLTAILAIVVVVPLARARIGGTTAPKVYNSADVAAAWQAHGLPATISLAQSSALPPGAPNALGGWYVTPTPFAVPFFGLTVFANDADARAFATVPGNRIMLPTRYAQRNVVLSYEDRDATLVAPYLAALADLR